MYNSTESRFVLKRNFFPNGIGVRACIRHRTHEMKDKNKQMWATGGNQSVGSLGRFILETYISFVRSFVCIAHQFPPADAAVQLLPTHILLGRKIENLEKID